MADQFSRYCTRRLETGDAGQHVPEYVEHQAGASTSDRWENTLKDCQLLIKRLQAVRPLLIDHFLAWNESLRIGRLMIAAVILECEAAKGYQTPRHRFVVHKLVYGCTKSADLFGNHVHFITFNYDASLEYNLYGALTSVDIIDKADARRFLTEDRIIHTYGCVHSAIPDDRDFVDVRVARSLGAGFNPEDLELRKLFLDRCLSAAQKLKTIDPNDKEDDEACLIQARKWIEKAGVIYILGYAFDYNNNRRIGLSSAGDGSNKIVMFTNLGDLNKINKKASKLFYHDLVHFSNSAPHGHPSGSYFEKSVRDVYDAFEKDFEAL